MIQTAVKAAHPGVRARGVTRRYLMGDVSIDALRGVDLSLDEGVHRASNGAPRPGTDSLGFTENP